MCSVAAQLSSPLIILVMDSGSFLPQRIVLRNEMTVCKDLCQGARSQDHCTCKAGFAIRRISGKPAEERSRSNCPNRDNYLCRQDIPCKLIDLSSDRLYLRLPLHAEIYRWREFCTHKLLNFTSISAFVKLLVYLLFYRHE